MFTGIIVGEAKSYIEARLIGQPLIEHSNPDTSVTERHSGHFCDMHLKSIRQNFGSRATFFYRLIFLFIPDQRDVGVESVRIIGFYITVLPYIYLFHHVISVSNIEYKCVKHGYNYL